MSEQDKKEKNKNIIAGRDFYVDLEKEVNSSYGVTQKYDRSNYDNSYAHRTFKDKAFMNSKGTIKKTTIDENGNLVYRYKADAKARFGDKKGELGIGDADHIDPLKAIHDRHKHNPFLSDKDLKEVGNRGGKKNDDPSHANFQLLKSSENRSKQDANDFIEGVKEGNLKKATKGVKAQAETDLLLTSRTAQNVGRTFAEGASDAAKNSVIPLVIVGTQDLIKVANGDMTMKEAVEDVGEVGLKIAVSGGSLRVASYTLSGFIEQSGNTMLQAVAKSNQIGTIVIAGTIVARATSKYISGEIDGSQFFSEISNEGLMLVAGIAGGALGGPLGTMIATTACSIMVSAINSFKENYKAIGSMQSEYLARLSRVSNEMIAELHNQREQLKKIFEEEQIAWNGSVERAFNQIFEGAIYNDMSTISSGLDEIMGLFGSETQFKNTNDVRAFMNQSNRVFTL